LTATAISAALAGDAPAAAPPLDRENPWPGPEAFREVDAQFFFGRERQRDALVRLILASRLVVLYGRSGLGKTSLLRAGVFPRLRDNLQLPVYIRLQLPSPTGAPAVSGLREQVKAAIEAAAARGGIECPTLDAQSTLWEWFFRSEARFFNERSRRVRPVLVFDQFEEAFTHGHASPALSRTTGQFLDELMDLIRGSAPATLTAQFEEEPGRARAFTPDRDACGIVLSLRQEFLAELLRLMRMPTLLDQRFELSGMTQADAENVVTQAGGDLIGPGVAQRIATFVVAARRGVEDQTTDESTVDPAILSIFCRELNLTRKERQQPRITADLVAGTQDAIIADFYRRGVQDVAPEVRRFVEEHLVTQSGYRNSAALDEALATPGITSEVLERLIERRLVRIDGAGPRARVELTHDVLIDPIVASRTLRRLGEKQESARREAAKKRKRILIPLLFVALVALAWQYRNSRREAERNLAAAHIQRAVGLMSAGQRRPGLSYIVRALEVDSENEAARGFALSAILHLNWPLPQLSIDHTAPVRFAAFDLGGTRVVTLSGDSTVRAWSAADGHALGERLPHGGEVFLVRWHPERPFLLTAARDGHARLWDVDKGGATGDYVHAGSAVTAAAIAASSRVATAGDDGTLRLWNPGAARPIPTRSLIRVVEFDRTAQQVAGAADDRSVSVWDTRTGVLRAHFTGHGDSVVAVQFAADGQRLLTASRDGTARVWDVASRKPVFVLHHDGAVVSAQFSTDGTRIVTGSDDRTARIWDARTGTQLGRTLVHGAPVASAVFSPEGARVLTASGSEARVWDVLSGTAVSEPIGFERTIRSATFSPDGLHVLTASDDMTATVWDVRTGMEAPPTYHGPCSDPQVAPFAPDGLRLAILCGEATLWSWQTATGQVGERQLDVPGATLASMEGPPAALVVIAGAEAAVIARLDTGAPVATLPHPRLAPGAAALSPDSRLALTVGDDRSLRTWDASKGTALAAWSAPAEIESVHFNVDGSRIVTASREGSLGVFDPHTGRSLSAVRLPLNENEVLRDARLSADGTRALTLSSSSGSSRAALWDVGGGTRIADLSDPVQQVQFAPDGSVALTLGAAPQLWDADNGRLRATLTAEDAAPILATFSRDGRRLVTAHVNGHFMVWDVATGQPATPPLSFGNAPPSARVLVRMAPDGQSFAAVAEPGTVRVWHVPTGAPNEGRRVARLLEVITGYRFNESGAVERVRDPAGTLATARADHTRHGGILDAVRDWTFADRSARTISPFSAVSTEEYVRRQLASGNGDAVSDARLLFPWHAGLKPPAPY
jgi:WD40 repeat protein